MKPVNPRLALFAAMEAYIASYVALPVAEWATVLALWAIGTWTYDVFDAYPYLVITSATKQSGKTRLSELLSFLSRSPHNFAAMTPAVLFRVLGDANADATKGATLFIDEAESLSSNAATTMRSVLNVGYRRGQTIPRTVSNQVVEFQVYAPKVFVLIGDVYDTLRDRSIVMELSRGIPSKQFAYSTARAEAARLTEQLSTLGRYYGDAFDTSAFMQGREAEIWSPLFALATQWCPERLPSLKRVATDLAFNKTSERRRFVELESQATEAQRQLESFSDRLLRDFASILPDDASLVMRTTDVIKRLRDIDTAPWRVYKGTGITPMVLADLLSRHGVKPALVKGKAATDGKPARGYRVSDVRSAARKLGTQVTG